MSGCPCGCQEVHTIANDPPRGEGRDRLTVETGHFVDGVPEEVHCESFEAAQQWDQRRWTGGTTVAGG